MSCTCLCDSIMHMSVWWYHVWTCELCSQEMNAFTGNITKFGLFCSFCTWKVLLIFEFQPIETFWYVFSCLRGQTSTKFHRKSGWPCRGSQEGNKKKMPCESRPSHWTLVAPPPRVVQKSKKFLFNFISSESWMHFLCRFQKYEIFYNRMSSSFPSF